MTRRFGNARFGCSKKRRVPRAVTVPPRSCRPRLHLRTCSRPGSLLLPLLLLLPNSKMPIPPPPPRLRRHLLLRQLRWDLRLLLRRR